jgi:hypothetical protein
VLADQDLSYEPSATFALQVDVAVAGSDVLSYQWMASKLFNKTLLLSAFSLAGVHAEAPLGGLSVMFPMQHRTLPNLLQGFHSNVRNPVPGNEPWEVLGDVTFKALLVEWNCQSTTTCTIVNAVELFSLSEVCSCGGRPCKGQARGGRGGGRGRGNRGSAVDVVDDESVVFEYNQRFHRIHIHPCSEHSSY